VSSTTTVNISLIGSDKVTQMILTTNDGSDDCKSAEHFDEIDR
jgi:hypothetical protein